VAEPGLLGRGRKAWDGAHDALLAARLLDAEPSPLLRPDVARAPVAAALARTLSALRMAGVEAGSLDQLASRAPEEDRRRLQDLARLYRRFLAEVEGRFADPVTLLQAAIERLGEARWLEDAEVLIVDELEPERRELEFVAALARLRPVRLIAGERPPGLQAASFADWAAAHGVAEAAVERTPLPPLAAPPRAAVMEFLTFAPVPFARLLGEERARPWLAQWDAISREAGIVGGLERWRVALESYAASERAGAEAEPDAERARRRLAAAEQAE